MIISVFGASGRSGRAFIAAASAAGVTLRLHYRSAPEDEAPPLSTVVVGALTDPTAVREVLRGAEAVVVLFGPRPKARHVFTAKSTKAIIDGMVAQGQRRLLCVTGAMIGEKAGNVSIPMRTLEFAIRRLSDDEQSDDRTAQEKVVRSSKLDWTLVKPPRLTDASDITGVRAAPDLAVGLRSRMSRATLAMFLLQEIRDRKYLQQAVFVEGSAR
jgi:putative NADH-flavin reductase